MYMYSLNSIKASGAPINLNNISIDFLVPLDLKRYAEFKIKFL